MNEGINSAENLAIAIDIKIARGGRERPAVVARGAEGNGRTVHAIPGQEHLAIGLQGHGAGGIVAAADEGHDFASAVPGAVKRAGLTVDGMCAWGEHCAGVAKDAGCATQAVFNPDFPLGSIRACKLGLEMHG